MDAIVKTGSNYGELEVRQISRPDISADEVLVRIENVGVCGSDIGIYAGKETYEFVDTPRVLGHEYSGTVVEIGADVTQWDVGDHIVERPLRPCEDCDQCWLGNYHLCEHISATGFHHDGAFTEFIAVPERVLHDVPYDIPHRTSALLEPISVASRAVTTNSRIAAGDDVLVEGPGPIGMLAAQVARAQGANVTVTGVGPDESYRLPLAEEYGFTTYNVETRSIDSIIADRTRSSGFDVIIDATGHPSGLESAKQAVVNGGQIVLVGIPGTTQIDFSDIVRSEVQIQCSYTSLWNDFETALELLASEQISVDEMIDDYSMDNPTVAFEDFKKGETVKPMFSPQT